MEKQEMKRLWITPSNDLEAATINEMLEKSGEKYLVTNQEWGASWGNLEAEIKENIKKAYSEGKTIYGVELQGSLEEINITNIDHHKYDNDDRTNAKSSLEQVAEILGTELTIDQQFVCANDKAYISGMRELGEKLSYQPDEIQEIIDHIRLREREIQGITAEQESQAIEAIEKLGDLSNKRDYALVCLPHSKMAPVTDRLDGKCDNILILSGDGETNFQGKTPYITMLNEKFPGGWSGGPLEDKGYGYWGGYADQEQIKQAVEQMVEQNRNEMKKDQVVNKKETIEKEL